LLEVGIREGETTTGGACIFAVGKTGVGGGGGGTTILAVGIGGGETDGGGGGGTLELGLLGADDGRGIAGRTSAACGSGVRISVV